MLMGFGATVFFFSATEAPAQTPTANRAPTRIELRGEPMELSLVDVLDIAFAQNLDIEIRRLEADSAGDRADGSVGIYDPVLGADVLRRQTESDSPSASAANVAGASSQEKSTDARASLSQLIPTGGVISVEATDSRVRVLDSRANNSVFSPYNRQRAAIAIRQPLLKNFGRDITDAGIRVARRQERIALYNYQQEVLDRLADVLSAYWELTFATRNLEVQLASLDAAVELERVNKARVDAGASPLADLLQARAQAAQRRNNVIQAKSNIINSQDTLLALLNWQRSGPIWNAPIVPVDKPTQYDLDTTFDDEALIVEALDTRPFFQAALTVQEIAEITRNVASWQRLPELNLIGEYGFNAVDETFSSTNSELRRGDYTSYFYGLEFRYPLLNRTARADYRASLSDLERAARLIDQAELAVIVEVRAATRAIRTAQESIEASVAQVAAAQETLDAERKRLEVGASTTFNVLDFQEDLALAQTNEVRAQVDFQQGLIQLERSRGTLLDALARDLGIQINFEEVIYEDDSAISSPDDRLRREELLVPIQSESREQPAQDTTTQ